MDTRCGVEGPAVEKKFEGLIKRTDELFNAMSAVLAEADFGDDSRSRCAVALAGIAVEHGFSIRASLEMEHVTSAIVLLRAQFEAVVRGVWVWYVAPDGWVSKLDALIGRRGSKEPRAPAMDEMLAALAKVEPAAVGRQLKRLKDAAWKPLNSYVHGGVHPVLQAHWGFTDEYAEQVLRNANGLATMGTMLMAVLTGEQEIADAMRRVQLEHRDVLPSLVEAPAH